MDQILSKLKFWEFGKYSTGSELKIWNFNSPSKLDEITPFEKVQLKKCSLLERPNKASLDEIIEKSKNFPVKFPIDSCRIHTQPKERLEKIAEQADSVKPVLHERALWLYIDFLEYKIKYGSEDEKQLYEDMTVCDLVQRLLEKRCVKFCNEYDCYMLLNGEKGVELYKKPETTLDTCISYDECKLSALLSISSHTEFLNDGGRANRGIIEEDKSKIETEGVVISLVGARFQYPQEMEYQDIVITEDQNIKKNGYGLMKPMDENEKSNKTEYRNLWNKFYNDKDFEYNEALKFYSKNKKNGRLIERFSANSKKLFDSLIMKKRYSISFNTLLLEAESRAAAVNKMAYIHVVGIGLGVWKYHEKQDYLFMETFSDCIEELKNQLNHVGYIDFSYFYVDNCNGLRNGDLFSIENHPNSGIKIFFSKRNPHEKLNENKFPNCMMVVSYAGDGNSLPGNEFWTGSLTSSSDPAAVCSTLISELHNTHINSKTCNGNNLFIASQKYGVIHIADFGKKVLSSE